jgi:hypothetical protein
MKEGVSYQPEMVTDPKARLDGELGLHLAEHQGHIPEINDFLKDIAHHEDTVHKLVGTK